MRKEICNLEQSPYENLAFEIYQTIDKFQTEQKGYSSLELDKEILSDMNFEIVNDFYNKNVLISCVIHSMYFVPEVEHHLMALGIKRTFIDKSGDGKKRYLTVWI